MRLAIFSDIHGNLESMEAFVADTAARSVDHYICLGDVVGYGASPNECFDRLNALPEFRLILGNHDAAAIWQTSPYEMSLNASKAILWTMDQLSEPHTQRIKELDALIQIQDMVFCHANPYHPTGWRYVTTWFNAMLSFFSSHGRITFIGHTHCPKIICKSQAFKIRFFTPVQNDRMVIDPDCRYIINCGSIGQPRDGNPYASYIIYDVGQQCIEFVRYPYDIEGAARRIKDAGLPGALVERLFKGY